MKQLVYILTSIFLFFGLTNCDEDLNKPDELNLISFGSISNDIIVEKNINSELEVDLYSSLESATERTYMISIEDDSTIDPDTYTLANSITIPSNSNKGSALLTINSTLLNKEGDILVLGIETEEEVFTSENKTINITLTCPFVNGAADLVGPWAGKDASDPESVTIITSSVLNLEDSSKIDIDKLGQAFMSDFWFETVISSQPISLEIGLNGQINIGRQYIFTTEDYGDTYEIEGTGEWKNCENKPQLILYYNIYYYGATVSIISEYPNFFPDGYLKATLTLQ